MVNKKRQCMISNHFISLFTSRLLLLSYFSILLLDYIITLPMLLFQIIIPTKTETLEYFTDIEDPISFGFINPRCHTIIKTDIRLDIKDHGICCNVYVLQNCIITLYHSYIDVYHVFNCLKTWYVLIECLDTTYMPFFGFLVCTWFVWQ